MRRFCGSDWAALGSKNVDRLVHVGQVHLPSLSESVTLQMRRSAREAQRTSRDREERWGQAGAVPASITRITQQHVVLYSITVSSTRSVQRCLDSHPRPFHDTLRTFYNSRTARHTLEYGARCACHQTRDRWDDQSYHTRSSSPWPRVDQFCFSRHR